MTLPGMGIGQTEAEVREGKGLVYPDLGTSTHAAAATPPPPPAGAGPETPSLRRVCRKVVFAHGAYGGTDLCAGRGGRGK